MPNRRAFSGDIRSLYPVHTITGMSGRSFITLFTNSSPDRLGIVMSVGIYRGKRKRAAEYEASLEAPSGGLEAK